MTLADYLSDISLSREDFARQLGVSYATVTRYVLGSRMPRKEHLRRIRDLTGGRVTANDFVDIDEEPARNVTASEVAA